VSERSSGAPASPPARIQDCNLLVSFAWRAPGRARREVRSRLRALGDPAPVTVPTLSRGMLAARTTLDPRDVVRRLRELCQASPAAVRQTTRWVPVDVWTAPDLGAMGAAVAALAARIAQRETWRMTVERRAGAGLAREAVIDALAPLISAPVSLTAPDRILLVELFGDGAALAVLAPGDVFSAATVEVGPGPAGPPA
jgi:tRNA(Ser,Leu) C12 N-acetylase TAN1